MTVVGIARFWQSILLATSGTRESLDLCVDSKEPAHFGVIPYRSRNVGLEDLSRGILERTELQRYYLEQEACIASVGVRHFGQSIVFCNCTYYER